MRAARSLGFRYCFQQELPSIVRAFVSGDEMVAVEGARIAAVGPRSLLAAWPTTSVVSLGAGQRLVPGFIG